MQSAAKYLVFRRAQRDYHLYCMMFNPKHEAVDCWLTSYGSKTGVVNRDSCLDIR